MDLLVQAVATLRSQPYGFLATSGANGPNQRLVQHLRVEDDASVWVGVSPASRKVRDVLEDPRASFAVESRESFAYVTVRGHCEVIRDREQRQELWEPGLSAFFPAGPGGEDFVLLRLVAANVELMDFAGGVHPAPYGLRAAEVPATEA